MADEFHAGLCSTMSWWNTTMRSPASFDLPPSIPCSTAIRDITATESVGWSTQPFLPVEVNQIQTGFGDSSMMSDQTLMPGLFEPAVDMVNGLQPASWPKFSGSLTHNQLSRVYSPSKQQLSFCNNALFWNPSSASSALVKIPEPRFEDESTGSNLVAMKTPETKRHGSDRDHQPAAKKARTATPSPLPAFKVRKEKLGDRITALQQLVSPFGKTDTASVLHEAIEYIKFLHGQVGALSTPYLKNGHQMQHQMSMESSKDEGVQDLRSRGLCLVPISSTFAVASETPMEFWAPTFLGSYSRVSHGGDT